LTKQEQGLGEISAKNMSKALPFLFSQTLHRKPGLVGI